MRIEIVKNLTEDQANEIDELWNEVYPIQLKNRFGLLLDGIEEYEHHVLFNDSDDLIGWAVAFLRNNEIWFSILIATVNQNRGYGRLLIDSLKQKFNYLCGWVIDHNNYVKQDGSIYHSPLQFYQKNGFMITDERIETDILSAVKIIFQGSNGGSEEAMISALN